MNAFRHRLNYAMVLYSVFHDFFNHYRPSITFTMDVLFIWIRWSKR